MNIQIVDQNAVFTSADHHDPVVLSEELLQEIVKEFTITSIIHLHQYQDQRWVYDEWSLQASDGSFEHGRDLPRKRLWLTVDKHRWHLEPSEVLYLADDAQSCLRQIKAKRAENE